MEEDAMTTVTVQTAELTGPALDWAVAQAEKLIGPIDGVYLMPTNSELGKFAPVWIDSEDIYSPSTNWAQGGPLIDGYQIDVVRCNDLYFPKGNEAGDYYESYFKATHPGGTKKYGPTPLVAAMRCLCCAKLGDTVHIPEELCLKPSS